MNQAEMNATIVRILETQMAQAKLQDERIARLEVRVTELEATLKKTQEVNLGEAKEV